MATTYSSRATSARQATAPSSNCRRHVVGALTIHVRNHDPSTSMGQQYGGGPADAGGSSGHHGHFPVQVTHWERSSRPSELQRHAPDVTAVLS